MRSNGLLHVEPRGCSSGAHPERSSQARGPGRRSETTTDQVVHHLYQHRAGPLPLPPARTHTGGGLLYVYCAGSAWVPDGGVNPTRVVGIEVWFDDVKVGEASTFVARPGTQFFTARFALSTIPAGDISVELRPLGDTRTQASDLFHLAVVEFRQKTRGRDLLPGRGLMT